MAFLWIIEAQEQIEEGGFSTSRWSNKSHHGSTGNLKSHILELELENECGVCFGDGLAVSAFLKEQQRICLGSTPHPVTVAFLTFAIMFRRFPVFGSGRTVVRPSKNVILPQCYTHANGCCGADAP